MSRRLREGQRRRLARETRRLPVAAGGDLRVAVAYPNEYRVGMANLGFHVVLEQLLRAGVRVDRVFLPSDKEAVEHRRSRTPLCTLEQGIPLRELDLLLFSLSFEPDYVGLVSMLGLGGVEALARRREGGPLVVAGGIAPTLNPEPIAPFCDLIGIGEAEALLPALLERARDGVEALAGAPGWYLPAGGPHPVQRQHAPLERPALPVVLSPTSAFSSHVDVEISRGCRWRCRFCAAGHVVTPYRELGLDALEEAIAWGVAQRGRVGLVGTDVSDHSGLEAIANRIFALGGEPALPSFRVESVARRSGAAARLLARRPPQSLTLAVEASSEGLRCALGKRLSHEKLLRAAAHAAEVGVQRLRIYLLVGIPGETWSEIEGIAPLVQEIAGVGPPGRLTVSINALVPKPGTPLQWEPAPSREHLRRARALLRRGLRGERVELQFESPDWTRWQYLLSQGGREAAEWVIVAAEHGWRRALARAEGDAPLLGAGRQPGDPLPWDHVEHGPPREALLRERERCLAREYVPPDRESSS